MNSTKELQIWNEFAAETQLASPGMQGLVMVLQGMEVIVVS